MKTAEWIKKNMQKYPDKQLLLNAACHELKRSRDSVRRVYNEVSVSQKTAPPILGLSEKDIRSKHDNMFKIRQGIKKLQKGIFLTDQQMRDFCKVAPAIWRGYSEHQDFEKYKYKPNSRDVYWATPDTIKKVGDINAY